MRDFIGTDSAFLALLFASNLLNLNQRQITPEKPYRQPATLRTEAFIAGNVPGLIGKQIAIKFSSAWGGLDEHKPLLDNVLSWMLPTPPKLDLTPITGSFAAPIP